MLFQAFRRNRWTNERPKTDGFYFCKYKGEIRVVRLFSVSTVGRGLFVNFFDGKEAAILENTGKNILWGSKKISEPEA